MLCDGNEFNGYKRNYHASIGWRCGNRRCMLDGNGRLSSLNNRGGTVFHPFYFYGGIMYTYKIDHVLVQGNAQLKLLYTLVEQNERIISLLEGLKTADKEGIKEVKTVYKPEKKATTGSPKIYACNKCGAEFDKPITKATHMRGCKGKV
jgi:predicted Zn-ribbon and HTH transcriptional regulator